MIGSRRLTPMFSIVLLAAFVATAWGQLGRVQDQDQQEGLAGTWLTSIQGQQYTLEIRNDGTLTFAGQSGTYTLRSGQLVVSMEGDTYTYDYQLRGDTLVFSGGDLNQPLTFTRSGGATDSGQVQQLDTPDIVGTWVADVNGNRLEMVLNANGTMQLADNFWRYTAGPGQLQVDTGDGIVAYNMQVSGSSLVLSGGDINGQLTFTRAGAAQTTAPDEPNPFDISGDQPGAGAGSVVGSWTGTNPANGAPLQLTVNADGTLQINGMTAQYTLQDDEFTTLWPNGEQFTYDIELSGNTMEMSGGDIPQDMTIVWTRSGGLQDYDNKQEPQDLQWEGGEEPTVTVSQSLVGTWVARHEQTGQEVVMVLNADGSMTLNGQVASWSTQGDQLTISGGGDSYSYNYVLRGNTLNISGGDIEPAGTVITWTRR